MNLRHRIQEGRLQAGSTISVPWIVVFTVAGLALGACSNKPVQTGQSAAPYSDPFSYCAAAGTVDKPGADYSGPELPASLASAVRKAMGLADDAPLEGGTDWRCMNGKVYACYVGANIPCWEKADESTEPNEAMNNYCADRPGNEDIPMVVTGRSRVYAWRCQSGRPERLDRVEDVDEAGYIKRYWTAIPAPE